MPPLADEGGHVVVGDAGADVEGHEKPYLMTLRLSLAQKVPPLGIPPNLSYAVEYERVVLTHREPLECLQHTGVRLKGVGGLNA